MKALGILLWIVGGLVAAAFWLVGIAYFAGEDNGLLLILSVIAPPFDLVWPALAGEWAWYGALVVSLLLIYGGSALVGEETR